MLAGLECGRCLRQRGGLRRLAIAAGMSASMKCRVRLLPSFSPIAIS